MSRQIRLKKNLIPLLFQLAAISFIVFKIHAIEELQVVDKLFWTLVPIFGITLNVLRFKATQKKESLERFGTLLLIPLLFICLLLPMFYVKVRWVMIILLFLMTNQTMTLSLTFGFKSLYNRLWLFNFYLALITAYTFSPAHDYTVLVHESSIDQVFPYIALIVIIAGLIIDRTNANRFIRSLKELQSARSAQNYFGASFGLITHNIRTPLAAIQNRLNILRLTQVKSDKEETTALDLALNKMEKDVSYISSTLESLITNFKATALKVNDTTPLSDFISDSADQYKPNLIINSEDRNESSLVLNQSEQFTLGIAVQCFVDNSRKYAKSPVHVSYSNRSISFQDSGNGFPENIIKTQGEDIVHSSTGHGIGLHLTRKLLGANEWTMTISNNATGGRIVLEKL